MEITTILFIYLGINQIFFIKLLIDVYDKKKLRELRSVYGIFFSWVFVTGCGFPVVSFLWLKRIISKN